MKSLAITVAAVVLPLYFAGPQARAADFELRPIDQATVRVLSIRGVHGRWVPSRNPQRLNRFVAAAEASHGSGVIVSPDGIVLTARHVIGNDPIVAVMLPGQDTALPARVMYRDPAHDIAFLKVSATGLPHVQLPSTAPALQAMQRVSVSGYPVDTRERLPAATSGEVSRLNNDGRLQLAMSLNPGNSGGAVIDQTGAIVGIVTHRGDVKRGVTGIVLVEPVGRIIDAFTRKVKDAKRPAGFSPEWTAHMDGLARWINYGPLSLTMRPTDAVELRMLAAETVPEVRVALAGRVWNAVQSELDRRGVNSVDGLPAPEARRAQAQMTAVKEICAGVKEAVDRRWRFASEVTARRGPKVSTFRGSASGTSAQGRRPKGPQEGLLALEGSLTVHATTVLNPLFGIGLGLGGHAAVLRYGHERGSQFLILAGGTVTVSTTFGDFEEVMVTGTLDIGIAGRFGGLQLAAYYTPGVSMVFEHAEWSWEAFRIEAGSAMGRSISYGTAYLQVGHAAGPVRALTGFISAVF